MFAVAFDLVVAATEVHHPRGLSQAYAEIAVVLADHGFQRKQGSLYTNETDNMVALVAAILALKALPWFPASVRDIRAFKVEQWSDFTAFIKA